MFYHLLNHVEDDPSGQRFYFSDFDLLVLMYAQFCQGNSKPGIIGLALGNTVAPPNQSQQSIYADLMGHAQCIHDWKQNCQISVLHSNPQGSVSVT